MTTSDLAALLAQANAVLRDTRGTAGDLEPHGLITWARNFVRDHGKIKTGVWL